jgi:hypothetical protein
VKRTSWSQGLSVTADGDGVVPRRARAGAVRLLADRVGLTRALSDALTRRSFRPVDDRGQVWVDIATMLTARAAVCRHVLGAVARGAGVEGCRHRSWRRHRCWMGSPPWSPRTRRRSRRRRRSRAATDSILSASGVTTPKSCSLPHCGRNAGSNRAGDHIGALTRAITQVPAAHRRRLLIRCDGAGATHELLDWLAIKVRSGAGGWRTRSASRPRTPR